MKQKELITEQQEEICEFTEEQVQNKIEQCNKELKSEVVTRKGAKTLLKHEKTNREKYGQKEPTQ